MKLIESSVQIIEEKDPYKMIELAGRTCYKSEDKITENSAKEFVDRMIKLGHGAMLEHGTIYLTIAKTAMNIGDPIFYIRNKYSKVNEDDLFYYITTNMRVQALKAIGKDSLSSDVVVQLILMHRSQLMN